MVFSKRKQLREVVFVGTYDICGWQEQKTFLTHTNTHTRPGARTRPAPQRASSRTGEKYRNHVPGMNTKK